MKPGQAQRDIAEFMLALWSLWALLILGMAVLMFVLRIYLWIANGLRVSDFLNILYILGLLIVGIVAFIFIRQDQKKRLAKAETNRWPTTADIEDARRMLYGDKDKPGE